MKDVLGSVIQEATEAVDLSDDLLKVLFRRAYEAGIAKGRDECAAEDVGDFGEIYETLTEIQDRLGIIEQIQRLSQPKYDELVHLTKQMDELANGNC